MSSTIAILLISGSTRGASTNGAALRAAAADTSGDITATVYDGLTRLPHFNPDDDTEDRTEPSHPEVVALRQAIAQADAVIFSTPEYAGTLPGSFKNLLDWAVGGGEIYEKPVGWINVSTSPTGAAGAHATLRTVLGYLGTDLVESACAEVPVARSAIDENGTITDSAVRQQLVAVLANMAEAVRSRADA